MLYKLAVPGGIENVLEVRVLEWHGEPGRVFRKGELVVELETHKANVEVCAAQAGILRRVLCDEGAWQRVGEALAVLSDDPDEAIPATVEELGALLVEFEIT